MHPGTRINRAHRLRKDSIWVEAKRADPHALVVPVAGDKVLMTGELPRMPVWVPAAEFAEPADALEAAVILGLHEGRTYLTIDLGDALETAAWLECRGRWGDLRQLGSLFDSWEGELLGTAKALVHWHRQHRFCGACGRRTQSILGGYARQCPYPECGRQHFPRTDPAVIVLVTRLDECLLARQPSWMPGRYSAVAGFVEPGESLEEAVAREVFEETGIVVSEVVYRFSQPWPFPGTLMSAFRAVTTQQAIARDDGELEDADWFSRNGLQERLRQGSLTLPPPFAASYQLIRQWFDEHGESLSDFVAKLPRPPR